MKKSISNYSIITKSMPWLAISLEALIILGSLAGCLKATDFVGGISNNVPFFSTYIVSEITASTASSGGTISVSGSLTILARGVCWSTLSEPTINDHKTIDRPNGDFISLITGLTPYTKYHVRAYYTTSKETVYADEHSFSTLVGDIDGNSYNPVPIGNQIWLKENLKTTRYANGDPIEFKDGIDWGDYTLPAWCYYNNDKTINEYFGKLYNGYAVSADLCPAGWHVPSDGEWSVLEVYLGGDSIAGSRMKDQITGFWAFPNTRASNSSGFTALPGGDRRGTANYNYEGFGVTGRFWTSTKVVNDAALVIDLVNTGAQVIHGPANQFNMKYGLSVRCIKD